MTSSRTVSLFAVLLVVGLAGCGPRRPVPAVQMVRVAPQVDLTSLELIGIMPVTSSAEGELGPLATRSLMDWARRDQGIVRMVELTPSGTFRPDADGRWSPEAVKALGRRHGVKTVLTGMLTVSRTRPDVRIAASLRSGRVSATVDVALSVQLLETSSGASIWSRSAQETESVGHVSVMGGGVYSFNASDPERAYGALVDTLVEQVTRDFRATWEPR